MDLSVAAMLFGAGVIGGSLSGLVGGAAIVTFPALLAAGLPPINAAASNIVASLPGNVVVGFADRSRLPPVAPSFAALLVVSPLAALGGAALLLLTPQRLFQSLIPLLLAFATVLIAFSPRISAWLRARNVAGDRPTARIGAANLPMLLPVSVYGGYFGAGVGVLALAILSLNTGGDYRAANVVKNILMALNTCAASALLIVQGAVVWPAALTMMAGAVVGGLVGGHLVRIVPPLVMRIAVVAIGALLTAVFAHRYWF